MSLKYDRRLDRMVGGNSVWGAYGHGMHQLTVDEMELGARVALELDDPEQAWWELVFLRQREAETTRGRQ